MNSVPKTPSRSLGQWTVVVIFGLLAVLFLFRGVQHGLKWVGHTVEGDMNFKALTLWALAYTIVCGSIAAVAYLMPREEPLSE